MSETKTQDHFLSNKRYNQLKFIAQIFLPALGALYFALAGIWGLPSAEEVVGTIVAVDTFLGVLLQLSTKSYNNSEGRFDGAINIEENAKKKLFSLELHGNPNELEKRDEVLFKINKD